MRLAVKKDLGHKLVSDLLLKLTCSWPLVVAVWFIVTVVIAVVYFLLLLLLHCRLI